MKNLNTYFLLLTIVSVLNSCKEEETVAPDAQLQADKNKISTYVTAHNIPGAFNADGIYYSFFRPDTGLVPVERNGVYIKYTERLMNGAFIDSSRTIYQYKLAHNYQGYNMCLNMLKKGGSARFFIPSDYVFGLGSGPVKGVDVPPFAIMDLELEILEVLPEDSIIPKYLEYAKIPALKTASGLHYYFTQSQSTGALIKDGNVVTIKYRGAFLNDIAFDEGLQPLSFKVGTGAVIKGFEEGVKLMKKGERAVFIMPHALAYGPEGRTPIPGYSILKFTMEITDVK